MWLVPEDLAVAERWVEGHYGAWDSLFSPTDLTGWGGLLDFPYEAGRELRMQIRNGEISATLGAIARGSRVVLRATGFSRIPAMVGQAAVVGESLGGDTRGSWLVQMIAADSPPDELWQPGTEVNTSNVDEGIDEPLLSRWAASLASNDPKAFAIVVEDVIRRMRSVEDNAIFTKVAQVHAGAAAQSLEIVLAEFNGEIDDAEPSAALESVALFAAKLVTLGITLANPTLGTLAQGSVMILEYLRGNRPN